LLATGRAISIESFSS